MPADNSLTNDPARLDSDRMDPEWNEDALIQAHTMKALAHVGHNITAASKLLGVTRRTIYLRLAKWRKMAWLRNK